RMFEIYGGSDSYSKYTKELFHCFGDPSMYFPTSVPTSFDNVSCNRELNKVSIYSRESATITFYDLILNKVTSYNGTYATYETSHPQNISICISGHNKIPYIQLGEQPETVYIQNENIYGPRSYSSDIVKIGSNVTDEKTEGQVIFNSGSITINTAKLHIEPQTTISNKTTFKVNLK
ncbi:MAG: hypothetical protein K2K32_08190, partial [Muribaculaceae bacterium]|nr:hypothetical protein [Muribaculaceae bacterium]